MVLLIGIYNLTPSAWGQQEPLYTQYINNQLTFNPAYAGSNKMLCAQLTSRNQWVGFNGRPVTNAFTIHSPIFNANVGGGLSFVNDRLGPIDQNSIYIDYAYQIKFANEHYLSMGLKAGIDIFHINLADIGDIAYTDPSFLNYENDLSLNFGMGLYYVSPSYYFGIGIPRLVRNSFDDDSQALLDIDGMQFYLSAGGLFILSDMFKYRPSYQGRFALYQPVLMEIMNWMIYDDTLWFGAGYRLNDSFNLGVQLQINHQLRVGYTYDYAINHFGSYTNGTHELSISYDFRFRGKNINSPRYF